MVNPFAEVIENEVDELSLVERAKEGDRAALEQLLLRHQAWVFNIAVRMVFQPQDAEEVTQEVLIKVVTRLSTFQGECKFRTWLYRIAVNHVLNMRRRRRENDALTFAAYGNAINGTPDLDLPDPSAVPVDVPILVEETKNACTMGMLLCLDRFPKEQVTIEGKSTAWKIPLEAAKALPYRNCVVAGGGGEFHFCPVCGSTVWYTADADDSRIGVKVGAFTDPTFPPPKISGFEEYRHPWALNTTDLPMQHVK